jgi:hypothetical protein
MKMLSAIGLAAVLAVSASAVSAERHGKSHHKKGWSSSQQKYDRPGHRGRPEVRDHRGHNSSHSRKVTVSHNYYAGHKGHAGRHYSARYRGYSHGYHPSNKSRHYVYRPSHHRYHHGARPYRHHSSHYRRDNVFPALLGAAIVGSVINHSLYHTHGGAVCYDKHSDASYSNYDNAYNSGSRSVGYSEVSGCHRIERMPDGSERRVDVPISQCY